MEAAESPLDVLAAEPPCLNSQEQCPWCGGDNQCRLAKGHLYKGPCWCHEITVPNHILGRLAAERIEPGCLCRPCLETIARISHQLDDVEAVLDEARRAISTQHDFYLDEGGNSVFTARHHLERGTCCANGCRHCPY